MRSLLYRMRIWRFGWRSLLGLYPFVTMLFVIWVSWYATCEIFERYTQNGERYKKLIRPSDDKSSNYPRKITISEHEKDFYILQWNNSHKIANVDVHIDETFIVDVWMSIDIPEIYSSSMLPEVTPLLSRNNDLAKVNIAHSSEDSDIIYLAYLNALSSWGNTKRLFGAKKRGGIFGVVGFSEEWNFMPHARDVDFAILPGSLTPLIKAIISQGMDSAEKNTEKKYLDAMAERIAQELIELFRLEEIKYNVNAGFLYFNGPIQFATLVLFIFCLLMIIVSIFYGWARDVADSAMGLVPYVGFFGTLLGMGRALGVLGEIDLSDPTSKAIHLGSIGNNIGVAIETTKYALVLYGIAVFVLLCRDACKRQ